MKFVNARSIKMRVNDYIDNHHKQNILFDYGCFWKHRGTPCDVVDFSGKDTKPVCYLVVDALGKISCPQTEKAFKKAPGVEVDLYRDWPFIKFAVREFIEIDGMRYGKEDVLRAIEDSGVEAE